MEKSPHLKKEHPAHPSMDFFQLRKEGFEIAQQLSGKIWTDYNDHDPGVTILEQLCYALTDLGYRTEFPIESLLYDLNDTPKKKKELEATFLPPKRIFSSNPLTINDYRKFLIDRIPEVQNIWVKRSDSVDGVKGLYRILIQRKDDGGDTAIEEDSLREEIKSKVLTYYAATRNLCEDVEVIAFLRTRRVRISANIDIASHVLGEEVLAQLLFELQEYLSPTIRHYSQAELEEEGWSLNEIFDGPMMKMGAIKNESLLDYRSQLLKHNLIEIMSSVKGVERVRDLKVNIDDPEKSTSSRVGEIEENVVLVLHTQFDEGSFLDEKLSFFKGDIPYEIDLDTARQIYLGLSMKVYASEEKPEPPYHKPSYLHKELAEYHSIQKLFPNNYGIGAEGLPKNVSPKRQAYANQLKVYLLFFEQILANYLSQLLKVRELFHIPLDSVEDLSKDQDSPLSKTYFTQPPYNQTNTSSFVRNIRELFDSNSLGAKIEGRKEDEDQKRWEKDSRTAIDEALLKKLQEISASGESLWKRRNKFLDHLLARFGEAFNEDFFIQSLLSRSNSEEVSNKNNGESENKGESESNGKSENNDRIPDRDEQRYRIMALAKIAFLQNYAGEFIDEEAINKHNTTNIKALGRERARGGNYQKTKWGSNEVSVLKERVCLMANMPEAIRQKSLIFSGKFLPSSIKPKAEAAAGKTDESKKGKVKFPLQNKSELTEIIREGVKSTRYKIRPLYTLFFYEKTSEKGEPAWNEKGRFISLEAANKEKERLKQEKEDEVEQGRANNGSSLKSELENVDLEEKFKILEEWTLYYHKAINSQKFVWKPIGTFDTQDEANEKKKKLIKFFQAINKKGEGFHLVEHILLRPQSQKKYVLEYIPDGRPNLALIGCEFEDNEDPLYRQDFKLIVAKGKSDQNISDIIRNIFLRKNKKGQSYTSTKNQSQSHHSHQKLNRSRNLNKAIHKKYNKLSNTRKSTFRLKFAKASLNRDRTIKFDREFSEWIDKTNFRVELSNDLGFKEYIVYLTYKNRDLGTEKKFARFQNTYASLEDVAIAIYNLQTSNIQDYYISMTPKEHRRTLIEEAGKGHKFDFYSMRMSILIPDWPRIFQNHSFLSMFINLINTTAPAHISIDYFLLSMEQMQRFEEKFSKWLNEKHEAETHRISNKGMDKENIEGNDIPIKISALDKSLFALDKCANDVCKVLLELKQEKSLIA